MKKAICFSFCVLTLSSTFSQNVAINTTGVPADASSILDISATDMGLLIPRLTLSATNVAAPVTTPADALLVYNTATAGVPPNNVVPGFYYWDATGSQWIRLMPASAISNDWTLLGNAGTNPSTNFVGTTDNQDLVFRTNNTENMRININGNVGIGTTSDIARLYVSVPNTDATTNYGIYNYFDGTDNGTTYAIRSFNYGSGNSTKYGIYSNVNSEGTGARYGIYSTATLNTSSNASGSGIRNYLYTYGSGTHYGLYNYVTSSTATGIHYGQRNYLYLATGNTNDAYGEYTFVDYSSGTRYGEYKTLNSNSTYDGDVYGDYNHLYGSGDGVNYGTYNSMEATGTGVQYSVYNDISSTGTGVKYGVYNNISTTSTGAKYGMRNEFADENGTKYGVYTYIPSGTATGTIYGTYNSINNDANATKYGIYNYISGGEGSLRGSYNSVWPSAASTSTIYGVYGYVGSSGTGTHYGGYFSAYGDGNRAVYGTNSHTTGYAGYFYGNGYWDGDVVFNESGTNNHDIRWESDTRDYAVWMDADEDLVRFGTNNIASDWQNGTVVNGTTVQYVADFDVNNGFDGTAIGIGTIEYLLDGNNFTLINNAFGPTAHVTYDLGQNALAWDDVYADNFVNVSDARLKTEVNDLDYGLEQIMQLRPVSYKWKQAYKGETYIPIEDRDVNIGFLAQDLIPIMGELVKMEDWLPESENNPNKFVKKQLDYYGINYVEMIPVLVKAIQQQQEQIEDLKSEIKSLKGDSK